MPAARADARRGAREAVEAELLVLVLVLVLVGGERK
jgi:hypothetical protein